MNDLRLEEHTLSATTSLSKAVVEDMIGRIQYGEIVIVAKQPENLLPAVRKEWKRQIRRRQNWRASTLDVKKIAEYTKQISYMEAARFSTKLPEDDIFATVFFSTAESLSQFAPSCHTMYAATPVEKEVLYRITAFMPDTGLVVVYRREE
jgi:hypothetical protein